MEKTLDTKKFMKLFREKWISFVKKNIFRPANPQNIQKVIQNMNVFYSGLTPATYAL